MTGFGYRSLTGQSSLSFKTMHKEWRKEEWEDKLLRESFTHTYTHIKLE